MNSRCVENAKQEIEEERGLVISAFTTYQYEEGFSEAIIRCPGLEKRIDSSRTYYRIVLPGEGTV